MHMRGRFMREVGRRSSSYRISPMSSYLQLSLPSARLLSSRVHEAELAVEHGLALLQVKGPDLASPHAAIA
jgi:hypothetical protein